MNWSTNSHRTSRLWRDKLLRSLTPLGIWRCRWNISANRIFWRHYTQPYNNSNNLNRLFLEPLGAVRVSIKLTTDTGSFQTTPRFSRLTAFNWSVTKCRRIIFIHRGDRSSFPSRKTISITLRSIISTTSCLLEILILPISQLTCLTMKFLERILLQPHLP